MILAVPPYAAAALVPGLAAPTEFRAIVNAHFRIEPAPDQPPILGLLNGTTEWVFAFPGRVAVTVSAADRLLDTPRDALARTIWSEVATATGLPAELPPWQIVRERRATFAATPEQDARRPDTRTNRAISSWPAIGQIRACPPQLKVPFDPDAAPPISPRNVSLGTLRVLTIERSDPALEERIERATRALLDCQQADGHWVFELEADATIPAEYVLMRHFRSEPVDAELERRSPLSAPHPGRARRMAAVP